MDRSPTWILSSLFERWLALFIDTAVLIPAGIVVGLFGAAFASHSAQSDGTSNAPSGGSVLVTVLGIAAVLFYAVLLTRREGEKNGQTVGKSSRRVRVLREDGDTVDTRSAVVREVGRSGPLILGVLLLTTGSALIVLGALLLFVWPLADGLAAVFDSGNRALHDRVAGTRVVHELPLDPQTTPPRLVS